MDKVNKNSKILSDNLFPTVEKSLKNPSNINLLISSARKYFNTNATTVFDSGLTNRIFFLDTDKKAIFKASGLDPKNIKDVIKSAPYIKDSWKIMNEPLNTVSALIARYLTIQQKEKELTVFLTYYSFYFYTSVYHKYLPYGAQENIMKYTINNLSNKYIIKQTGSLYKTLEHTVMTSHTLHRDALIEGTDKGLADYISSIKVRINNFVKNIKNEYTQNHANKKFINFDTDSYDEENFHIADNNSYVVQNTTDSAIVKLTTYGPDMRLVKMASSMNKVSENEIRNVINKISSEETNQAKRLIELILQLYLFEGKNTSINIHTNKFLFACIDIYKKSNTNDKLILEIKTILNDWLKKYSVKYNRTNRTPTLSAFRRAVYIYFVLHIQQSN